MVTCFDEGMLDFLDKNNKDNFDVDIIHSLDDCFEFFLLAHPLQ